MAAIYNWEIFQGNDFSRTLILKDGNNDPVDITGWSFESQLRETVESTSTEAEFTIVITDAVNGELTIGLTDVETGAMTALSGVWDFQATKTDATIETLIKGGYDLVLEVTR